MRVTNNMRQDQVLRNISSNLAQLTEAQQQVSTGKRFTRPAEDPVAAAQVMRADQTLRGVTQFRRTQTAVQTRLDSEEGALNQITDLLSRARELATSQATSAANDGTRAATAAEVDRILEQMVTLGNTRVGGEYVFAGHQSSHPAFADDGSYLGDQGEHQAEISAGYLVNTTHNGQQVFVQTGVFAGLKQLRDALRAGNTDGISAAGDTLAHAFDGVQTALSEVGARGRQLQMAGDYIATLEDRMTNRNQSDQGISLEEATTRMLSIQNTYQAALASTSRLLNLSLTDYLR